MRYLLAATMASVLATGMLAQETTRQIVDAAFWGKRKPPTAAQPTPRPPAPPADYRPSTPTAAPPLTSLTRAVGLTVWRLRAVAESDRDVPRLLVPERPKAKPSPVVPERLGATDVANFGDRLRLGIEVSQEGYLYVIDRERYADGTLGEPFLLFPAADLRGGDNRVGPGQLVDIPSQTDEIPALVLERSSPRHVGEELLVLVTLQPLPGITAGPAPRPLAPALVAEWERQWSNAASRLDLIAGRRQTWTSAEQLAGAGGRPLSQADPMPQALYYADLRNDGLLVRIPLTVR